LRTGPQFYPRYRLTRAAASKGADQRLQKARGSCPAETVRHLERPQRVGARISPSQTKERLTLPKSAGSARSSSPDGGARPSATSQEALRLHEVPVVRELRLEVRHEL